MSAYIDLHRLAQSNGGKLPAEIPAHYVSWAYVAHRVSQGRVPPRVDRPAPVVITLGRVG